MRTMLFSAAVVALVAQGAPAADCTMGPACCDAAACCDCGCPAGCKVVCEMKTVKKTVWVVECEEYCTSLPGCPCSGSCGGSCCGRCQAGDCCGGCDCCCDPCAELRSRQYVPPRCGEVRCRKVLVEKEIECEVPSYKCVPISCGNGCSECGAGDAQPATPAAPIPAGQSTSVAPLPPVMSLSYQRP